jgi:Uma2 family endonuclease
MTFTIAKFGLEEYHQMVAVGILDDRRVELLNGEIVEMSPEGEPHAYYSRTAAKYLEQRLGDAVEVLQSKPITIPRSSSEPEPDIAIVQPRGREYLSHHPYPENIFWVIEYSNTSIKKDLEPKAKVYADAGILEYWVVNLKDKNLVVMRDPVEGEYRSRQIWTSATICPVAFPAVALLGNAIAINRLFD